MALTNFPNLTLPTPSVTVGPTWASDLNTVIEGLAEHTHTGADGARLTPAALDMTSDLDMQENNVSDVRSVRFVNHSSALNGSSDVASLAFIGGNLYAYNGAGTAVRITNGASVDAGSSSGNTRGQTTIASNTAIQASDTWVTALVNTSSARTITLPAANSVAAGRFYRIVDNTGSSGTNAITIARTGSDTIDGTAGNLTLSFDRGVWDIESDGTSAWVVTRGAPSILTKSTLTLPSGGSVAVGSSVTLGSTSLVIGNTTVSSGNVNVGGTPATAGGVRLANNTSVSARNVGNTANVTLVTLSSGDKVQVGSGATNVAFSNSGNLEYTTARTRSVRASCSGRLLKYTNFAFQDRTTPYMQSTGFGGTLVYDVTDMLIDGATLASVDVTWQPTDHMLTPATKATLLLHRWDATGTSASSLFNPVAPEFTYTPGTNTTQTFTCSINNVIDRSTYFYILTVEDENGANSEIGNRFKSFKLNFTTITTMNVPQ